MSLETVKCSMKSRLWINNLCLLTGPITDEKVFHVVSPLLHVMTGKARQLRNVCCVADRISASRRWYPWM